MSAAEEPPHCPPTIMAMTILGLIMAYLVAAKASRDALFLSQFSTSNLPAMVAVAAIGAVAMSMLGSRMLIRLGPNRMTAFSFALSGVMQVAEWMLFGYRPRIAACLIYVHVVAFGSVLVSAFWSLMNESYEPRSAKTVFGKISGSGTLGGFLGGLLAERVAALFSAQRSFWCWPRCTCSAPACCGWHSHRSRDRQSASNGRAANVSRRSSMHCTDIRFC